jgi:hypothetical protein
MPNVPVDLPSETYRELLRRADAHGQSQPEYLTAELTRLAASPAVDDVFRRVATRTGGRVGLAQAAEDLAAERARD